MTERNEGVHGRGPYGLSSGEGGLGIEAGDGDQAQLIALMCAEARRLAAGDGRLTRVVLRAGEIRLEMERATEAAPGPVSTPETAYEEEAPEPDVEHVTSPVVGTFYRAPEPGRPPFVEVGATVDEDTVVGIVEAMKLMNKIVANRRGVVTTVLVPDATPVEYGQPLLAISPPEPAP